MPEGTTVAVEATLAQDVDEVRRGVLLRGVPAMSEAKYKLSDQGEHSFVFARRYLPRVARNFCVFLVVLAVIVQSSNGGQASPALALGWMAILAMIFYRRTENVGVDIRPVEGGTRVVAAGMASKQGRAALDGIMAGASSDAPA